MKLDSIAILTLIAAFLSTIVYFLIAPLLPFQFDERGIPQNVIGIAFAMYSLGVIFFSPVVGKLILMTYRENIVLYGLFTMGISFLCFGLAEMIKNPKSFTIAIIFIRTSQGMSTALINTALNSIAVNLYPDNREELLAYQGAAKGLGAILGPLVGSILFTIGGYSFVYYLFGGIFVVYSIISYKILTSDHEADGYVQLSKGPETEEEQAKVSLVSLFKIPRFLFGSITGVLSYFMFSFLEPILALRLSEFNLSVLQIGSYFALMTVSFFISCLIIKAIPKGIQKRAILISICFMLFFANILLGPSQIFGFPDNLLLIGIGATLVGALVPGMFIISLPEIIDAAIEQYPDQSLHVNEASSAMFTSLLGFGQLLGLLYGSFMTASIGFRLTCDLVALFMLGFSSLYFCLCNGVEAFQTSHCKEQTPSLTLSIQEIEEEKKMID